MEEFYYSDKYADNKYEYRHVVLPKSVAKLVPKDRLMVEWEWRALGVQQSRGWMHYMLHRPEPHILLFRRQLNYQERIPNPPPPPSSPISPSALAGALAVEEIKSPTPIGVPSASPSSQLVSAMTASMSALSTEPVNPSIQASSSSMALLSPLVESPPVSPESSFIPFELPSGLDGDGYYTDEFFGDGEDTNMGNVFEDDEPEKQDEEVAGSSEKHPKENHNL